MESKIKTETDIPGHLGIYGLGGVVERGIDPRMDVVSFTRTSYFAKQPFSSPAPGNGKDLGDDYKRL
ncbi:MAG: hypothetical protein ABIA21_02535 [Candidatus Aenigmatarchaeota archaeon]